MTQQITEAEAAAYVAELYLMEQAKEGEPATLLLRPFTAFTMVGALQLATRHPEMSPVQRQLIGSVIDQMRPLFAGTPGEQLLHLGDDPDFDIEHSCQYPYGPHSPKCPPGGHPGFAVEGEQPL